MKSQPITFLTDAVLITAVVPTGRADTLLKAVRDAGAMGGIVHSAKGIGARERLGLLGIAVDTEKEVVSVVASADHQNFLAEVIYNAGEMGVPGNGYLFVSALERMATYIPEEAMARLNRGRT